MEEKTKACLTEKTHKGLRGMKRKESLSCRECKFYTNDSI